MTYSVEVCSPMIGREGGRISFRHATLVHMRYSLIRPHDSCATGCVTGSCAPFGLHRNSVGLVWVGVGSSVFLEAFESVLHLCVVNSVTLERVDCMRPCSINE